MLIVSIRYREYLAITAVGKVRRYVIGGVRHAEQSRIRPRLRRRPSRPRHQRTTATIVDVEIERYGMHVIARGRRGVQCLVGRVGKFASFRLRRMDVIAADIVGRG